jgi:hypothetical protein
MLAGKLTESRARARGGWWRGERSGRGAKTRGHGGGRSSGGRSGGAEEEEEEEEAVATMVAVATAERGLSPSLRRRPLWRRISPRTERWGWRH